MASSIASYRFEPLSRENRHVWLETAGRCSYATINVLDDLLLGLQIENGSSAHIIIYENDSPLAIFPGELSEKRFGPAALRVLTSRFGGIFIADGQDHDLSSLKEFMRKQVLNGYYSVMRNVDYMDVVLPPKVMIEDPSGYRAMLPFPHGDMEANSILYATLEEGLLDKFKYNVKWEVRKGLEKISRVEVLNGRGNNIVEYLIELESQKAAKLKIKPVPASYFKRVLSSGLYHALVAVSLGRPLSAVIYTLCKDVGTFHYNASSPEGKKAFINKALLFRAMQICMENGARYFMLGNGWEMANDAAARGQLEKLSFFKRSFSTGEAVTYRFRYPLTRKGRLALFVKRSIRGKGCE